MSFPHSPLKGWENYRSPNLVSSASWEMTENQHASKTFPNLQVLTCKPSLPQMLVVRPVLTETPLNCLQHYARFTKNLPQTRCLLAFFPDLFFFLQQVHFPLQGIWQMGDRFLQQSQVEHEFQPSWHSRTRLTSNSTVSSLKLVIHRQLWGEWCLHL